MTKKITIAIDAMGGENAPDKTIEGVGLFINKFNNKKDYTLNLFGPCVISNLQFCLDLYHYLLFSIT